MKDYFKGMYAMFAGASTVGILAYQPFFLRDV